MYLLCGLHSFLFWHGSVLCVYIYGVSLCPSVRASLCPSVRVSGLCPEDIF